MDLRDLEKREIRAFDAELEDRQFDDDQLLISNTDIARYNNPCTEKQFPIDFLFLAMGCPHDIRILDVGCGHGIWATILGKLGNRVTGADLSLSYLDVARRRAKVNEVDDQVGFIQASAHSLPFPSNTFDMVIGNAILHHVDLRQAGIEVFRVLKQDGRAIFKEPIAFSAALRRFRKTRLIKTVVEETRTSPDEEPLTRQSVNAFGGSFSETRIQEFQLLSRLQRLFGSGRPYRFMNDIDIRLLQMFPPLRHFARIAIIEYRK